MQARLKCAPYVCGRFLGVKLGVANLFFGQSIGIDENNTFQLKC